MSGPFARVAVLGLGLVGGSLARLLAARGVTVTGQDVDPGTVTAARAAGLAATSSVAEALDGADLVVLAVPLRAMRATAAQVARHLPAGATLTDVGSVKGPVRQVVDAAGLGGSYVGAHPMAGTEHSGFAASSADLLDGVPWAVTVPVTGVDAVRLERVLRLVTGPLRGRAAVLTDDVHDEAAALISHVPHVVATQLLNAVAGAPVRDVALGLAAGSFRDGTRVARTDPARTEAMVTENAAWVAPTLRKLVRDLGALATALEENAPVHEFFRAADAVRSPEVLRGRVRAEESGDPGDPGAPGQVGLALAPGWVDRVVDRCASGAVVTAVTATEVLLAR